MRETRRYRLTRAERLLVGGPPPLGFERSARYGGQPPPAIKSGGLYIALIDVPGCGISTRGDFEPLTEKVFYRVQAILDGRLEITAPRPRNNPGLSAQRLRPLRGVRNG
jgi:hypothetical protein